MDLVLLYEHGVKDMLRLSGLHDDMLHLLVGLALLFGAAVLLRRPLSSGVPVAVVALVELANELADRLFWGSWLMPGTISDLAYTLALPLLITMIASEQARLRRSPAIRSALLA